jgi:hypothetical protein
LAERARRLAAGLLDGPDRDRLLNYSAELDQKAAGLNGDVGSEGMAERVERQGQTPKLITKPPIQKFKDKAMARRVPEVRSSIRS